MSAQRLAAAATLIALLAGCGTTPILTPISSSGSPTPGVTATPGPSAEIEIDITGGPHAGSYRAVAQPGCDSKPAQNRFTVTYADDLAPGGFVALHLVLRDAALALQDESDDFLAEISVGGAGAGISYAIDPVSGGGSGSALLETSPFDATLSLSAVAPDGAQVELIVICDFS